MNVAILLCTYNGENFLQEQLDSYLKQTFQDWHLFVCDDGSTDSTLVILEKFKADHPDRISIFHGKEKNSTRNFLYLASIVPENFDYYTFSDQDDIWLPKKIEEGIKHLSFYPQNVPCLYGARTELVNEHGKHIGFSPLFSKKPSFQNALIQSIAGGNTMVFNNTALKILRTVGVVNVVAHDWLLYQIVSGVGGNVYYDQKSNLLYRQHGNNLIGSNNSFKARIHRIVLLFKGQFKYWNSLNIAALQTIYHKLTPKNQQVFDAFVAMHKSSPFKGVWYLYKFSFYRQTLFDTIGLLPANLFRKI